MAQYPAFVPSVGLILDSPFTGSGIGHPGLAIPSLTMLLENGTSKTIGASTGVFSVTGNTANLLVGHKLVCAVGSFTQTGIDATLTKVTQLGGGDAAPLPSLSMLFIQDPTKKRIIAAPGTFTITGNATIALNKGHGMTLDTGVFVISGAPADRDIQITASGGSFVITGQAATLSRPRSIVCAVGSYSIAGKNAGLNYQQPGVRTLICDTGQFGINSFFVGDPIPGSVTFVYTRAMQCSTGSFAISGVNATLRAPRWADIPASGGTWSNVGPSTTTWNAET